MATGKMDMEMRRLYKKIQIELDKVRYDRIWPGFSRMEFAIYNKETVFFENEEIPYDKRFLGNTSIDYNGRYLAIFYVEEPRKEDIFELTSNIVHEMFHSYQALNGEIRFPDDLKGLDFPKELKNYEIKYRENKLIVKALDSLDRDTKLNMLKEIIGLRILRTEKYGDQIKYEFAIETGEGSAEYCGSKALRDISEESYQKRMKDYKDILSNNISLLFDTRRISYYTGTLLLLLLDELDISFTWQIRGQSEYIFEEVAKKLEYNTINVEDINEPELEKHFTEYRNKVRQKFQDFYKESIEEFEGDFKICGYDPMNMIKYKDKILCSRFIMLIDESTKNQIFIEGPVVVKLKEESHREVTKYYSFAKTYKL